MTLQNPNIIVIVPDTSIPVTKTNIKHSLRTTIAYLLTYCVLVTPHGVMGIVSALF